MSSLRPPTLPELAAMIRDLPDGPERARLEEWYWAKVVDRHGVRRARSWQWEYEWLKAAQRTRHILADLKATAAA